MNKQQIHPFNGDAVGKRGNHPVTAGNRRSRTAERRRGRTLLEALIATLIALFIGSALLVLVQSTMTARTSILDGSAAMRDTRTTLDTLDNKLRNAQIGGPLGVFSAAGPSSVTYFTDTTGTLSTRYWLDTTAWSSSFKQTSGGVTTVLLTDVQSVLFTYYTSSSANYTSPSSQWTTTANPNAPTDTELPNVGAVNISVVVTSGGVTRTLSTLVRLRNSPAKPHI